MVVGEEAANVSSSCLWNGLNGDLALDDLGIGYSASRREDLDMHLTQCG